MLKWLGGGKPDHPMADPKEARRLIAEIGGNDAQNTLAEISGWIESLQSTDGFKPDYRQELVRNLDEAGQAHLRRLTREYLSLPRPPRHVEMRLWSTAAEFCRHLVAAYSGVVDDLAAGARAADSLKSVAALTVLRGMRALSLQYKWSLFRYGPVAGDTWPVVGRLYAYAEAKNLSQQLLQPYSSVPAQSSACRELIRMLALAASAPDALAPHEVEIADRVIGQLSSDFLLSRTAQPDSTYWIDLTKSASPVRALRPPDGGSPNLYFFAPGKASERVAQIIDAALSGALPPELNVTGTTVAEELCDTLTHVASQWSAQPMARKHQRHRVKSRLAVCYGFTRVLETIGEAGAALDFLNDSGKHVESWVVEDVSRGGFGASVTRIRDGSVEIGSLLGMQPDGGDKWLIGVARRIQRDEALSGNIGIETISRAAKIVSVEVGSSSEQCIALQDSMGEGEAHVIAAPGRLPADQSLTMLCANVAYLLIPQQVVERGPDYERLRCRCFARNAA